MASNTPEDALDQGPAYVRKPKKKPEMPEPGSVNITSLMDAVTIILTFLLVSINMDPFSIKQNQFLQLAKSSVSGEPKDSLAVFINRREITVDSKKTVPVECVTANNTQCRTDDEFAKSDNSYFVDKVWKEDASDASFLLVALKKSLEEQIESAKELHVTQAKPGEYKPMVTIISDKFIPYAIIAQVVHTVGSAGVEQMRFAVIKDSKR
jgi:biopolymer transport protein ExbD